MSNFDKQLRRAIEANTFDPRTKMGRRLNPVPDRSHRAQPFPTLAAIAEPMERATDRNNLLVDGLVGGTARYMGKLGRGEQMDTLDYFMPALEVPGGVAGAATAGLRRAGRAAVDSVAARGAAGPAQGEVIDQSRREFNKKAAGGLAYAGAASVAGPIGHKVMKELGEGTARAGVKRAVKAAVPKMADSPRYAAFIYDLTSKIRSRMRRSERFLEKTNTPEDALARPSVENVRIGEALDEMELREMSAPLPDESYGPRLHQVRDPWLHEDGYGNEWYSDRANAKYDEFFRNDPGARNAVKELAKDRKRAVSDYGDRGLKVWNYDLYDYEARKYDANPNIRARQKEIQELIANDKWDEAEKLLDDSYEQYTPEDWQYIGPGSKEAYEAASRSSERGGEFRNPNDLTTEAYQFFTAARDAVNLHRYSKEIDAYAETLPKQARKAEELRRAQGTKTIKKRWYEEANRRVARQANAAKGLTEDIPF